VSNALLTPQEVAAKIVAGNHLLLAGEEKLLASLPPGNWIGGTIPYFMTAQGGCLCLEKIFVTEITYAQQVSLKTYSREELPAIYHNCADDELAFVILPAESSVHMEFALNVQHYKDFAAHPLLGWIAGVNLADLGQRTPKVFCGSPRPLDDAAAVMRVKLPAQQSAQIGIINLFAPGKGDVISFKEGGFHATNAIINGQERNLAQYLAGIGADTRLPLVANYSGAMINVSFKNVDQEKQLVEFYAPVVSGVEYHLAAQVDNYVSAFEARLEELAPGQIVFSCNCILNYLYSQLEGHHTGGVTGPITFGEIAYQLLNQTLVYLTLEKHV